MPAAPAVRRRAPEVRRQQVLDAAEVVLRRHGLDALTMADVAQQAGVAKGTPYLYFPSKAALIAALRARYLEQFAAALRPAAAGRPATRLARFVDGLFSFSAAHADLHHVLFHEAGFSEEDAFAGARRLLASIVADGVARAEMSAPDADLAAAYVLHGVHGVLVSALHHGGDARRGAAVATALARATLGVSPPARR